VRSHLSQISRRIGAKLRIPNGHLRAWRIRATATGTVRLANPMVADSLGRNSSNGPEPLGRGPMSRPSKEVTIPSGPSCRLHNAHRLSHPSPARNAAFALNGPTGHSLFCAPKLLPRQGTGRRTHRFLALPDLPRTLGQRPWPSKPNGLADESIGLAADGGDGNDRPQSRRSSLTVPPVRRVRIFGRISAIHVKQGHRYHGLCS
jgi:hypothetical protein